MKHFLLLLLMCSTAPILSQNFEASNIIEFQGEHNSHEVYHADAMGNIYISGQGTGDFDFDFGPNTTALPVSSFRDLYLAKYDVDNNLDWLLSFDGTVISNQIRAMIADDEGNIYIAGAFSGRLNLTDDGQNEITSFGSTSMFVAKFDQNGELSWQFTVGDTNFSQYPDELYISNNRLIIQFVYTGTFDVDPGPGVTELSGSSDAMLVYDLDGSFIEANTYTGNTNVRASVMDSDGNLYVGGSFGGLVSFDYKSFASVIANGISDAFVAKYDSDFNLLWVKMISKTFKNLRFTQLDLDSENDLVASGYFAADTQLGTLTTDSDANYLTYISKDGEFENIINILPESCFITDLSVNSKDQIILNSTFSEVVDLDPMVGIVEITPVEDYSNYLITVYESDFTLTRYDQINAIDINTHSLHLNASDQIMVLTDYEGEGKVVFGNQENYMTSENENFIYYELDIEGCSTTMEDIYLEACNEIIINGEVINVSGQYQQVLVNAEGCDSIVNLTIEIFPDEFTNLMLESCDPIEIDGVIYSASGTYTLFMTSIHGCDSTVVVELEIIDIDNAIVINGTLLESLENDAESYQWFECGSEIPIEGATEQTFMPEKDGSYQVQITKNSCIELTSCIDFVLSSTIDIGIEAKIWPNPTNGLINIQMDDNYADCEVSIFNFSGQEVLPPQKLSFEGKIDLSLLTKGIYFIKLENGEGIAFDKIVVY